MQLEKFRELAKDENVVFCGGYNICVYSYSKSTTEVFNVQ